MELVIFVADSPVAFALFAVTLPLLLPLQWLLLVSLLCSCIDASFMLIGGAIEKSVGIILRPLLSALWSASGGKLKAGNEKPAAAAAWSDCNNAAECSCALRRNSATEVVRGSDDDDRVETPLTAAIDDVKLETAAAEDAQRRLAESEEIADAAETDEAIDVGQHEQSPGNAAKRDERWRWNERKENTWIDDIN